MYQLLRSLSSPILLVACAVTAPAPAQCVASGTAAFWQVTHPGCGTPSVLAASANPILGTAIQLQVTNLPSSALLVGLEVIIPPTVPLPPTTTLYIYPLLAGCSNWVPNYDELAANAVFGSSVNFYIAIPNNTAWIGLVLQCQSAVASVGASIDIEMSNSICLFLGL